MQSLSDLLNVQNDFLSVWVNYEVQRLALDFDLGDHGARRGRPAHASTSVPLAAYIAGAETIRQQLCNATDLYPTLSPPADGESSRAVAAASILIR